ncbi:hypothetical protein RUM43_009045 [Polyplax serrata]|uniref:Uncharacterized protein n=1 Tax=Polyplax serrata TaxID=468196 RepID=A0AAN8S1T1_POLSC
MSGVDAEKIETFNTIAAIKIKSSQSHGWMLVFYQVVRVGVSRDGALVKSHEGIEKKRVEPTVERTKIRDGVRTNPNPKKKKTKKK